MFTNKEWLLNILAGNIEIIENKGIELKEGLLNVDPTIYNIFNVDELSNRRVNELIKLAMIDTKKLESL